MKNKSSQKGKWGKVGAPPKEVKFPRGKFTIEEAVEFNRQFDGPCELTVRKTIEVCAGDGKFRNADGKVTRKATTVLVEAGVRKQADGGVGRPSTLFAVKGTVKNTAKPVRKTRTVTTPVVKVEVKTEPVTPVATPVPVSPVTPVTADDVTEGSEVPAAFQS